MTRSTHGFWKTIARLFKTEKQKVASDFEESWFKREEARQIEEVKSRLDRVREQLADIDERRVQRGH